MQPPSLVVLAVCGLLLALCGPSHGAQDNLHLFDLSSTPDAVCNDGSPAGFYFTAGSSPSAPFLVHLQGGAWCYDESSCAYRFQSSPQLMSSKTWPSYYVPTLGIFSRNASLNPLLADANIAYAYYCTSDNWSGNASVTYQDGTSWQFQGKAVVRTILSTLYSKYGLAKTDQVVFSGCSAGGQGVVVNLDYAADVLTSLGYKGQLHGVADAGWLQNLVPYSGDRGSVSIAQQMVRGAALWGGAVDATCAAANPGWEWLCYCSPFAVPHIRTPVFVQAEQYDTYQVTSNCCNPPFDAGEAAYVQSVREAFEASMGSVKPPASVYSAACFHHCSVEDNSYYEIEIEGFSMSDVFSSWYVGGQQGTPTFLIDHCRGFNCSTGCPSSSY